MEEEAEPEPLPCSFAALLLQEAFASFASFALIAFLFIIISDRRTFSSCCPDRTFCCPTPVFAPPTFINFIFRPGGVFFAFPAEDSCCGGTAASAALAFFLIGVFPLGFLFLSVSETRGLADKEASPAKASMPALGRGNGKEGRPKAPHRAP